MDSSQAARAAQRLWAIVYVSMMLAGCTPLGPQSVLTQRPLYNAAVQETDAQQLLLNIVRQRYNDPVSFLEVTSISSGSSRIASATLLGRLVPQSRHDYSGNVAGSYSETPIIFYSPNSGEKFMRQMLRPLDLRTLALVLQSGWSIERTLLLAGEAINGIRNGTPAYLALLADLRELQRLGFLQMGLAPDASETSGDVALLFSPEALQKPAYQRVCTALAVACDGGLLRLEASLGGASATGKVGVSTRSLYTAFYHLAQTVEVPPEDDASGAAAPAAAVTRAPVFRVRHAVEPPPHAAVKVAYRDRWYFIDDTDRDSKVSFALVSLLITLQAGDPERNMPLFALPLN